MNLFCCQESDSAMYSNRKDPYKMDKEEILIKITKLKKETETLHKFLESSHKKYVTDLMLVDMIREKERNGA